MENYTLILNLTQHQASDEQKKEGVIDLPSPYREKLIEFLTFKEIPSCYEIERRAGSIFDLVIDFCVDNKKIVGIDAAGTVEYKTNSKLGKYVVNSISFRKFNFGFLIGGALWLMSPLINELELIGFPLFAFTKRKVEEVKQPDGSIKKIAIFKHEGFIPACC